MALRQKGRWQFAVFSLASLEFIAVARDCAKSTPTKNPANEKGRRFLAFVQDHQTGARKIAETFTLKAAPFLPNDAKPPPAKRALPLASAPKTAHFLDIPGKPVVRSPFVSPNRPFASMKIHCLFRGKKVAQHPDSTRFIRVASKVLR